MAWFALSGTTWHSLQFTAARMVVSVRWSRWVPTTLAGSVPAGASGGAASSSGLVAVTGRPGVPWQAVQLAATFARPFTWPPPVRLMVPLAFTVDGWHWLQVAAVTVRGQRRVAGGRQAVAVHALDVGVGPDRGRGGAGDAVEVEPAVAVGRRAGEGRGPFQVGCCPAVLASAPKSDGARRRVGGVGDVRRNQVALVAAERSAECVCTGGVRVAQVRALRRGRRSGRDHRRGRGKLRVGSGQVPDASGRAVARRAVEVHVGVSVQVGAGGQIDGAVGLDRGRVTLVARRRGHGPDEVRVAGGGHAVAGDAGEAGGGPEGRRVRAGDAVEDEVAVAVGRGAASGGGDPGRRGAARGRERPEDHLLGGR